MLAGTREVPLFSGPKISDELGQSVNELARRGFITDQLARDISGIYSRMNDASYDIEISYVGALEKMSEDEVRQVILDVT